MATNKKITDLPLAGTITGAEIVPVVQSGVTVQTTFAAIMTYQPVMIPFVIQGLPPSGQVYNYSLIYGIIVPANFSGTVVFDSTIATSNAIFTLRRISSGVTTTIGTITITPVSNTSATLSIQSAVTCLTGDTLQIVAPTQDATLSDLCISLLVNRVS